MNPIVIFDLISFLATLTTLLIILWRSKGTFGGDVRLLLSGLLVFTACYHLCLFLEWSGVTRNLDPYEDFIGALIPMWWAFLIYAFLQDIASRDLRESEAKYRLLIDNYSAPITVYDRNGMTLVMNYAAAAQWDGHPEDFIGKKLNEYVPDLADIIMERVRRVIDSGMGLNVEDLMELPSGKKWFWSSLHPVEDANGNAHAVQAISYDITERKLAEEALQRAHEELELRVKERTAELVQANEQLQQEMEERKRLEKALIHKEKLKTLGAIAAEVAHEIRNPLVSIGGFAKRLKQKLPDSYESDIILNESKRLEKMLSRIKNYLEPVEIHPTESSINNVLTDCVHLLSPETKTKRLKCVLELSDGLPPAHVDPGILAQVFINLIRNATEASKEGETLFIKTFEDEQELKIEFKNRAQGAKPEDPETLFMPFAEGGRSIGLPLCYRLLKDMGGHLSFVQEQDFIVFTVSLAKAVQHAEENNRH